MYPGTDMTVNDYVLFSESTQFWLFIILYEYALKYCCRMLELISVRTMQSLIVCHNFHISVLILNSVITKLDSIKS